MKNKKIIIIVSALVLALIIALVLVLTNGKKYNAYEALKNMKKLDSYTINIYQLDDDDKMYEEEILIGNNIDKITSIGSSFDLPEYHYNGKLISGKKDRDDKEYWYYVSDSIITSSSRKIYKEKYNELFDVLGTYLYDKVGDKFTPIGLIDSKFQKYLDNFQSSVRGGTKCVESIGCYEVEYKIRKIEITLDGKYIKSIVVPYYDSRSNEEEYKFVINFSKFNDTKVYLPDEVVKSLDETTAKEGWVGTYSYEVKCSNCGDANTIKNQLILSDEFDFVFGTGFRIKCKFYDGEYLNITEKYYYVKGDTLYIVDSFGNEVLETGKIYKDKIELLNESGEVKETFIKES